MASIPKTHQAFIHDPNATSVRLETRNVPEPEQGEVLLKVEAAGLCHSDLHILSGTAGAGAAVTSQYAMSHEVSGTAVKNGPGATAQLGRLYVVLGVNPCLKSTCPQCSIGRDSICTTPRKLIGTGRDGGFAGYVSVPETALVPVPAGVTAPVAAIASDAILTPYHGIKRSNIQAGQTAIVIGLGGLGLNAALICQLKGAKVYATDVRTSSQELAKSKGINAMPLDQLKEIAKKESIDLVVDCVGSQVTFADAQALIGVGGSILLLGLKERSLPLNTLTGLAKEVLVRLSFWGTKQDLVEVLDYLYKGQLHPTVQTRPLLELPQSIEDMRAGKVEARLAFIP